MMTSRLLLSLAIAAGALASSCAPAGARPCRSDDQCEADERCDKADGDEVGRCAALSVAGDGGSKPLGDGGGGSDAGADVDAGADDDAGTRAPDGGGDAGPPSSPVAAVQVAVGGGFQCARTDEGTVFCWGYNSQGQLGRGEGLSVSTFYAPEEVPGLTGVTDLTLAEDHACAIGTVGAASGVFCWGAQSSGELGVPPGNAAPGVPIQPVLPSSVHDAAAELSSGERNTCVRTTGRQVWCWGAGIPGFVVQGGPLEMTDLFGADSLEHSDGALCARMSTGPTRCVGSAPVDLVGCSVASPSDCAALDDTHAFTFSSLTYCQLDSADGQLRCAGDNDYGLVVPASPGPADEPLTALAVTGADDLRLGPHFGCAVETDGDVTCWGRNLWGSTGRDATFGSLCMDNLARCQSPSLVPEIDPVDSIDTHDFTTCGVTASGAVWCWGRFAVEGDEGTTAPVRYQLRR